MRKLVIALLMGLIILTGCNISFNNGEVDNEEVAEEPEEEEEIEDAGDLALHILKIDEQAGVTAENDDLYGGLQKMIDEDPTMGAGNDFTVRTLEIINTKGGDSILVLLGINRVDFPLTNISFDLTIGNKNGDHIWEDYPITMSEDDVGTLEPNSAVPILLSISEEEEEHLMSLDEGNLQVIIENFEADELK